MAVSFGSLEAIAKLKKIILQRARLGLVDRAAEVPDQLLDVEAIDRNALGVVARGTVFESSLALWEWIAVAKQWPAFRRSRLSQPAARYASRSQ